jgi:hypothetical protein
LTGAGLAGWRRNAPQRWHLALSLTWCVLFAAALFFLLGWFLPPALPRQIRGAVGAMGLLLWVFTAVSGAMLVYMIKSWRFGEPLGQWRVYVLHAGGLGVFLAVTAQMMVSVAPGRSAGPIAASVKARLAQAGQVVFYDTYVAGGLFYLQTREPLLLVTSASKKQTFLGNFYALGRAGESPAAASTAILTFEEFRRHWQDAKRPLLVIVKEKNVPRMTRQIGEKPAQVGAVGEYVLVTKP